MSPNWLINVLSPLAGIPLFLFAATATLGIIYQIFKMRMFFFIINCAGLMPYNYVCVHSGRMLANLKSLDDLFSLSTLAQMAVLALVALGPSMLIKKTTFAEQMLHPKKD